MSDPKTELERLKAEIERADDALAAALDSRAKAAVELHELQQAHEDIFLASPRAVDMVARLGEQMQHFPADAVRPVVREVLSACSTLTDPLEVVFVGTVGGFGHLAARKQFGSSTKMRGLERAEEVVDEVARGKATYGMLPFETSYDGTVTATLNLLARGEAKICAEVPVTRAFHLMSTCDAIEGIKTVYASASAITACETYLEHRLPGAVVIDVRNGLVAAERAREDKDAAALGTAVVAEITGLEVVERSIEDVQDLKTRYVAVGNDYPPRTGNDRTAIALALHDAPGVLLDCLKPFAERDINLYRLETRPARGWEFPYLILFELDGHITDRPMLSAIEALKASSRYVKVLGSYPRHTEA